MVDRSEPRYGQLVACDGCDRATKQTIARCWSVSSMDIAAPNPPSLVTLEPYTPEADTAIEAISAFIRERFGWLTLTGGSGTGKSHALESIARYFLVTGLPCVYIASLHLWEYLGGVARGEHDQTDYAERFRWLAALPALVIDELNVESATPFVFKTRRALLDARYRGALAGESVTVLASNDEPGRWQDGAVADRALDTRFVAVHTGTKSYRQVKREQAS
jgi:DNA replication protein DnaC